MIGLRRFFFKITRNPTPEMYAALDDCIQDVEVFQAIEDPTLTNEYEYLPQDSEEQEEEKEEAKERGNEDEDETLGQMSLVDIFGNKANLKKQSKEQLKNQLEHMYPDIKIPRQANKSTFIKILNEQFVRSRQEEFGKMTLTRVMIALRANEEVKIDDLLIILKDIKDMTSEGQSALTLIKSMNPWERSSLWGFINSNLKYLNNDQLMLVLGSLSFLQSFLSHNSLHSEKLLISRVVDNFDYETLTPSEMLEMIELTSSISNTRSHRDILTFATAKASADQSLFKPEELEKLKSLLPYNLVNSKLINQYEGPETFDISKFTDNELEEMGFRVVLEEDDTKHQKMLEEKGQIDKELSLFEIDLDSKELLKLGMEFDSESGSDLEFGVPESESDSEDTDK